MIIIFEVVCMLYCMLFLLPLYSLKLNQYNNRSWLFTNPINTYTNNIRRALSSYSWLKFILNHENDLTQVSFAHILMCIRLLKLTSGDNHSIDQALANLKNNTSKGSTGFCRIINPMEIFPLLQSHGNISIESFNFAMDNFCKIVKIINPSLSSYDLDILYRLLSQFYIERGMWSLNPLNHRNQINVIKLPHNQYPCLTEFAMFLNFAYAKPNVMNIKRKSIYKLLATIRLIINEYPIYNRHTKAYGYHCTGSSTHAKNIAKIYHLLCNPYTKSYFLRFFEVSSCHRFFNALYRFGVYKHLKLDPYSLVRYRICSIIFNREVIL